ncbi:MAG TPA: hypothetical protein VET48_13510, partial [Steroidobacteraceae bacterium]|nr:hypothetical protein [Steroidobacteraceae bacterium]
WSGLEKYPPGHTSLLIALEETLTPVQLIIIRGVAPEVLNWQRELNKVYAPRRIVLGIPANEPDLPAALAEKKSTGETIGYVCHGQVCSEPLKSLAALIAVARE